jgi:hypothetical protein
MHLSQSSLQLYALELEEKTRILGSIHQIQLIPLI